MRKVIGRVLIGGGIIFLLAGIVQVIFIHRETSERWTFLVMHVMFGILGIGIGINTLRESSKDE